MKTITVNLGAIKYDVKIENGLLNNMSREIKEVYGGSKIAVITDENVYGLYGAQIKEPLQKSGYEVSFIIVEPGEKSKSIDILKKVYEGLINNGITRSDLIVAFGGGVIGDLSGFAASTFLRGVRYIQVPTSLLAQIDSSIGGKVAVNLEQGKNLVGSFYHPVKVIIDPMVLHTLSEKLVRDGLGEVVKYACIKDEAFYDELMNMKTREQLFQSIDNVIYKCLNIKKELVERDEKDAGDRMLLNFGHTFGHAIENYFNYEYSHGEAVSLGMYYITEKSESLGLTEKGTSDKIKDILINFNIQYKLPSSLNMDAIKNTIYLDKKNISGSIKLILLKKIGASYIESVPVKEINNFFEENI